jgi:succinoglycan biosynthesis protein ExoO
MSPKVSVIVPAYNAERYVENAVYSALAQTLADVEIIVVDDASTDATAQIVAGICDDRVRLLRNERNCGPAQARNLALRAARGEWIAFLDADDWFAPNRLEVLLNLAAVSGTELVADDLYLIRDGADRPWGSALTNHTIYEGEVINALRFITMDRGLQPMILRNFLTENRLEFNEELRSGEDNLLILNCLLVGGRLAITTKALYYYRNCSDSLTSDRVGSRVRSKEVFLGLLRRQEFIQDAELRKAAEERLVKINRGLQYYRVIDPLRRGDVRNAAIEAWRNPSFFILLFKSLPVIFRHRLALKLPRVQSSEYASHQRACIHD